jgi:hypothetical protein
MVDHAWFTSNNLIIATLLTIVTLIAGPVIASMLEDHINITPNRLVKLLENGEVSKFNDDRKKVKQQIVFEGIDVSNRNLSGVNLKSLTILHSNLFNTLVD